MKYATTVLISIDSNSLLSGAREYEEMLKSLVKDYNMSDMVEIVETGTFGFLGKGVVLQILPDNMYYLVSSTEDLREIFNEHLLKGRSVGKLLADLSKIGPAKVSELKETRIVLRNIGKIDPSNIGEYIARDGYMALGKAFEMGSDKVISEIKESGLRGRGGAGFPTGLKWGMTSKSQSDKKYVLCNADEGEPGTFKDRLILEGDPHSIIEAMTIAGFAIGADTGYIYIRGEYYNSIERIQKAIKDAEEYGLLGEDILGSGFSFRIAVRPGAGA